MTQPARAMDGWRGPPGRGGSTDGPEWSPDRAVGDVVAVVDTLAEEATSPVDVLGHSFGGHLALRAAARTSTVRLLVLYEPAVLETSQPAELVARMQAGSTTGGTRTSWTS